MSARARWSLVIGSTLILWAVSERLFWSMWRPGEVVWESLITFLMYGLAVYIMLCAIDYFRVSSLPAMILIGALYGWIVEGIISMTVFGLGGIPLPFSLSWTALAWHMPFSVIALWWWYHKAVAVSFWSGVTYAVFMGLGWGLWSMTWFFEAEPVVTTVGAYAIHAIVVTVLMMLGHLLMGQNALAFTAPKIEKGIVFGVVGLFFAFVTVPTTRYSLVVIPALGGLVYFLLSRHQRTQIQPQSVVLQELTTPVPLRNLITLFLSPIVATFCYALMLSGSVPLFPINYIVLTITTTGGFILFGWAWYRVQFKR